MDDDERFGGKKRENHKKTQTYGDCPSQSPHDTSRDLTEGSMYHS